MRFLCEQCKAKYQISDDKVAGKTVRMKCRKCGHMIEVRADVTETSVANAAPADPLKAVATAGAPAKPGSLPRPATKPIPPRSKLATSLTASQPPKAANPSALAGAFQRTVAGAPASSMRPAQNPDDSQALDMLSASANPWYVAINGVPVGPVRLSELRRKAQSGIVTESSLVWQEGAEEWRPVKTFPELAQIVREAAASGRPSLVSSPPGERTSQIPGAPRISQAPAAPTAARAPAAPRAPAVPAARSNVVPIGSRATAAAEQIEEMDFEDDDRDKTTVDAGHSPVAPAAPVAAGAPAGASAGVRPSVAPDPFAVPPAAAQSQQGAQGFGGTMVLPGGPSAPVQPLAPPVMSSAANPVANPYRAQSISIAPAAPAPRQINYTVLALLFAAVAFGVTAAVVVFSRPQVVVQTVASAAPTIPPSASATASIAAADIPPPSSAEPADSSAVAVTTPDKPGTTHASGSGKSTAAAATTKATDPSIAALLNGGPGGPTGGTTGGAGPSAGLSALSGSEIEAVVNNRKVGVTRTCWERNNGSLSSANVTCHVTIAANGTVSSSNAEGSDPVVAKCIESQVRSWTFPPSSGSTQVNLPFHFVRQ
jgi:predicted Zn finger-like uncharacterized protein